MKSAKFLAPRIVFLSSLILFFQPVYSEVATVLYSGITHTNNLEVQSGNDIQSAQDSLNRTGFETGVLFSQQSLGIDGGYRLEANATFNKDLSGTNDIARAAVSGSKLSALTPDWLLRNSIGANWYRNEALPDNSYIGISMDNTLGYLNNKGGGTDFSLLLRLEQHDQLRTTAYDIFRTSLGATHYFPHERYEPYWGIQTNYRYNNADDNRRDYHSFSLGLQRHKLKLASFTGQLGFNWQHDRYDKTLARGSNQAASMQSIMTAMLANESPGMPTMPFSSPTPRVDNLYYVTTQLGKALTPKLNLQLSVSVGRYDSSLNKKDENFYGTAIRFSWKL